MHSGAIVRGHVKIEYGTLISNLNVTFAILAKHFKIIVLFITDYLDFVFLIKQSILLHANVDPKYRQNNCLLRIYEE